MKNTGSKTQEVAFSNRSLGNNFENEFCGLLFNRGFWTHRLQQNSAGQPADVLAVKNGKAYLIDCKVCSDNRFALSRIEDNQHLSMDLWRDCGNGEAWFALKVVDSYTPEGIPIHRAYMIPHFSMKALAIDKSSLSYDDIREYGTEFGKWVSKCK